MFEKILFPTDFSECAGKSVEYIIKLREADAKEVIILHVVDDSALGDMVKSSKKAGFDPDEFKRDVLGDIIQDRERAAEADRSRFEGAGLKTTVRIEFGKPSREICRMAEDEKVSLIVMGAQGRGRISSMLLGSVSEGTMRNSRVPVLIVR
ncbi:MAG TPA: universal stress protein [Methanoregulaceae archaeon]|nr:universal stress protein [Methanoregulaceae archaeon]